MCFDKCLKGRENICCCGCSTRLGINLIAILTLAETGLVTYLFAGQLSDGIFNLKVFSWLFISLFRTCAYFQMCFDTISKRRCYLWSLIGTTIIELAMFTIMNVKLFDKSNEDLLFEATLAAWGLSSSMQIAIIEILSIIHLIMFIYFCSVSYEWWSVSRDDPAMIDAEHKAQAAADKKAAADRKKAKEDAEKQRAGGDNEAN